MEAVIKFFELLGIVVFAITGALEAIKSRLDILGVVILGIITAVGGGIIRDLVLGINPPHAFVDPVYIYLSFFSSLLVFLLVYYNNKILGNSSKGSLDMIMTVTDAMGLAVFTVLGMKVAFSISADYRGVIYVFVGVISGVGGGILRDVLLQKIPYVLERNVYASASIIGALVFYYLSKYNIASEASIMIISILLIFIIRIVAAKKNLQLPKAN